MADTLTLGSYTVVALDDGSSHLPPSFFPGADFRAYPELLDETGTYPFRVGAFLVLGPAGTVLIDAGGGELALPFPAELAAGGGLSAPPEYLARSGRLPESLRAAAVRPAEVTAIVLTHLHLDHIGWIVADGEPYFPNAAVYYGAADWDHLVAGAGPDDPARAVMQAAEKAGILRPLTGETVEILPGLRAAPAPGHTPGHYTVGLDTPDGSLIFTGDLIQHPAQLTDDGISFATDEDLGQARQVRAELFERARAEDLVIATAHLGNPVFRRITGDHTWADATASDATP